MVALNNLASNIEKEELMIVSNNFKDDLVYFKHLNSISSNDFSPNSRLKREIYMVKNYKVYTRIWTK